MSAAGALPEGFTLTACGPAERAEQAALFNRCFKKRVEARDLAWRYDQSPHGASASFVVRAPSGRAVSGYACSPRRVLVRGDERTLAPVGETGDVMTDPEFRKRGLFSLLDRACMEEGARRGWPCVFGLPNQRSAHIFLELGWSRVGSVRAWTHLLRSDSAARAARRREGRLAGLLCGFAARRARALRARWAAQAASFSCEEASAFPVEVEELVRAVEPRFEWMLRRDRAWLDWRFARGPSGLHRILLLRDAQGALGAYAVVQLPRPGEAGGWLVDLVGRDEEAVRAALSAGLERLLREGASCAQATAIDGSWWQERLREASFLPPRADRALAVILWLNDPEHPLARAGRDASRWYLTDGDRDDETVG